MQILKKNILRHCFLISILVTIMFGAHMNINADAGDPYPLDSPLVFIAQGLNPTKLYTVELQGDEMVFVEVNSTNKVSYNAMGFNTVDGYLYAIKRTNSGDVTNILLKIGQEGKVVSETTISGLPNSGTGYNQGTFGEGDFAQTLFVRRGNASNSTVFLVNTVTSVATTLTLSEEIPNVADLVFLDGYLWSLHYNGNAYRIDPNTGEVNIFKHNIEALNNGTNGAQWVNGNGNIGVSQNQTGMIYQISIDNSTSSNPTFTLVNSIAGPKNSDNDGAAVLGAPADLGIEKSGPATYQKGDTVVYTLTITNYGSGRSSGSFVKDQLPEGLINASTTTSGCSIINAVLTCNIGTLNSGEAFTIEYTATADALNTKITNSASVLGNEADPNSGNNQSTHTINPLIPSLSLSKSYTITDTNNNSVNDPGDIIIWTFIATNTGDVKLEDISINDPLLSALSLNITCSSRTLDINESMICQSDAYTILDSDVEIKEIVNIATVLGKTIHDIDVESEPAEAIVTIVATPTVPEEPIIPEEPVTPEEPIIPEVPVIPDKPIVIEAPHIPEVTHPTVLPDTGAPLYTYGINGTGLALLGLIFIIISRHKKYTCLKQASVSINPRHSDYKE